jgi:site-specific DNA recombinase
MTTKFIAYTRVSTARQGTKGVSLAEQRHAIQEYAIRHDLNITDWFNETQSAAKRGRPMFDQVMSRLEKENGAVGLIIHKVDRGARNLRDWASIGEAIDLGVAVRFAHDDFDMSTRGGRLAADIQAVIAADYIRNLREEVRKGIQGRLRQGLYPLPAPHGYLDCGGGQVKRPDPVTAPLIIAAFERYVTGQYTYTALAEELMMQGLANRHGRTLSADAISHVLRNPFYVGKMPVGGQTYQGIHQPLISEDLFAEVQRVRRRRSTPKLRKHDFRYRRQLTCLTCTGFLTGERQKRHIYYRCHRCPRVTVREDRVQQQASQQFTVKTAPSKQLVSYQKFESLTLSAERVK